jgi:ParB-like chromosome segregation protein Spo0J
MSVQTVTSAEAQLIEKLTARAAEGANLGRPDAVHMDSIKELPELFQPRDSELNEKHVQDLIRGLKGQGVLDPVLVLVIGAEVYLLDGHHRMRAYRTVKKPVMVPVVYFEGIVKEAVMAAGAANSKVKLAMTNGERQDYAWRLVRAGCFSKSQISRASGVSVPQIDIQRKTLKTLGEAGLGVGSWSRAQRQARGLTFEALTDDEMSAKLEAQAEAWADQMARAFGTKMARNPEVAARALAIYFGRKTDDLTGWLREMCSDEEFHDPDADF